VLTGHVWVQLLHALGVGWAAAANSFSALGAAVAIAILHALAARVAPAALGIPRPGNRRVPLPVTQDARPATMSGTQCGTQAADFLCVLNEFEGERLSRDQVANVPCAAAK